MKGRLCLILGSLGCVDPQFPTRKRCQPKTLVGMSSKYHLLTSICHFQWKYLFPVHTFYMVGGANCHVSPTLQTLTSANCLRKKITFWVRGMTSLGIFLSTHKSCTYFSGFSKAVGTFSSLSFPPPLQRPENMFRRSVETWVIHTCCSSYLGSPNSIQQILPLTRGT